MAKQEIEVIKNRDAVEVTVTKAGGEFKHNSWKEGDKVSMHRILAEKLKTKGLVK